MAFAKRLKNIAVSHAQGQVGLSLTYDQGPQDHLLLSTSVAKSLVEKLINACEKAGESAGDSVAVSDHVQMKIGH